MHATSAATGAMLQGLQVIELAQEPGTRYCGRLLSVMGATVVRIAPPPAAIPSGYDQWLDEGKAAAADFEDALDKLQGRPDLILAGQTPKCVRAADALVAARNCDAVRAGLTWFGMSGPYADWHGDDALIQALTGVAYGFGPKDGLPTLPQGRTPQIIGGATLFIAALAALWARRSGQGPAQIDVSVLEASLCLTEVGAAAFAQTPGEAARDGVNRYAVNYPFAVYPTADGWLGVTALTPPQWANLARLIGRPDWADDPRFTTSPMRVAHCDILDAEMLKVFPTRRTDDWLYDGQKLRIPLAPVPQPAELPQTEHWKARESFAPLPGLPGLRAPRLPFRVAFDGHMRPPPACGGKGPLTGLRVIDFTMGWAGPLCTRHLADLGADVIKIESHSHIDWWRGWDPPGESDPPTYECMPNFNAMNRGKRGINLDLTTKDGVERVKALVAGADIVVENYAAGVMEKLGLGPDTLMAIRPGLVMVSMGAFGATGPWSHFRAYGSTVEHASGLPHVNGDADWPPCLQHVAFGDPIAGIYGAVAALAGLYARLLSGGSWIDLSQVECLFQLGADAIIAAQTEGPPKRKGSRNQNVAPRCVVAAANGTEALAIVAPGGENWLALCALLGRSDWVSLKTPAARNARADEIEQALSEWASSRSAADAAAVLQASGVPAAPVIAMHQLGGHPHLVASGTWTYLERRYVGRHLMASPPYLIDEQRLAIRFPAPLIGEYTEEVLAELAALRAAHPGAKPPQAAPASLAKG